MLSQPQIITLLFLLLRFFCVDCIYLRQLLATQPEITVPLGRSYDLSDADLGITKDRSSDLCTVYIYQNDAQTARFGYVSKTKFSCTGFDGVTFYHLGVANVDRANIKLRIEYESGAVTQFFPLTLTVRISKSNKQSLVKILGGLVVDTINSKSINSINSNLIQVKDSNADCRMAINPRLALPGFFPQYGQILEDTYGGTLMKCDRFLTLGIRYLHHVLEGQPISSSDQIPLVIEISPKNGEARKMQYFTIDVKIRGDGVLKNVPPTSTQAMVPVGVFIQTFIPILPENLAASDDFTSDPDIIFNVIQEPQVGRIVSTDNPGFLLQTFTQRDVQECKIAYVPPNMKKTPSSEHTATLIAKDQNGLISKNISLKFVIRKFSSPMPFITTNEEMEVMSNANRATTITTEFLNVTSPDISHHFPMRRRNPIQFTVNLKYGPKQGYLTDEKYRKTDFTMEDILQGSVKYNHNDYSKALSDNFVLEIKDGENKSQLLFRIAIRQANTERPMEVHKKEVVIKAVKPEIMWSSGVEAITLLTIKMLWFNDKDSSDFGLFYKVSKRNKQVEVVLSSIDGRERKTVMNWTQQDMHLGRVWVRYKGPSSEEPIRTTIKLTVHDSLQPEDLSFTKTDLTIKVSPFDNIPPRRATDISNNITVYNYATTVISGDSLRYYDRGSTEGNLLYRLKTTPFDTDATNPLLAGEIRVKNGQMFVQQFTFTQNEVNDKKVYYYPPDKTHGVANRIIEFVYEVEDEAGNILKDQHFTIKLNGLQNKPPRIFLHEIRCKPNEECILGRDLIDVSDPERGDQGWLVIGRPPNIGYLRLISKKLIEGSIVTMEDIRNEQLAYVVERNILAKRNDDFVAKVVDSTNVYEVIIRILITEISEFTAKIISAPSIYAGTMYMYESTAKSVTRIMSLYLSKVAEIHENRDVRNKLKAHLSKPNGDYFVNFKLSSEPGSTSGTTKLGALDFERTRTMGDNGFRYSDVVTNTVLYTSSIEVGVNGKVDNVMFNATLFDKTDTTNPIKLPRLEVHINILPVNNKKPILKTMNSADVFEGKRVDLQDVIKLSDADTGDADLFCLIDTQPRWGYVEDQQRAKGVPISGTSYEQIKNGHIYYVQSFHSLRYIAIEQLEDQFYVVCGDGASYNDSPKPVNVKIKLLNDEEPHIELADSYLSVMEGQRVPLASPNIFLYDFDYPANDLYVDVVRRPVHGSIVQVGKDTIQLVGSAFPGRAMDSTNPVVVYYQHDNTENFVDEFILRVTDARGSPGAHNVTLTIPVRIKPLDDTPPQLTANLPLTLQPKTIRYITNNLLDAIDVDSPPSAITYVISETPHFGDLQKLVNGKFISLKAGKNFTQAEVDQQTIIRYNNSGGDQPHEDRFVFNLTDGINSLPRQSKKIFVKRNFILGDIVRKSLFLNAEGKASLSNDILPVKDIELNLSTYRFLITYDPLYGSIRNRSSNLRIFTQNDVDTGKVYYHGYQQKMDYFQIELNNQQDVLLRTFKIAVISNNNKYPILSYNNVTIDEGGTFQFTPQTLRVEDDSSSSKLKFSLTRRPKHGSIKKKYSSERMILQFTMKEIEEGKISYKHDGSEPTKYGMVDDFKFLVDDDDILTSGFYVFPNTSRLYTDPVKFTIYFRAIDNKAPKLVNNELEDMIFVSDTVYFMRFDFKHLLAIDDDSDNADIIYNITVPPSHGYIANSSTTPQNYHYNTPNALGGITQFTQADVNNSKIYYALHPYSEAISDSFTFSLIDPGGNVNEGHVHKMFWTFVAFSQKIYVVNETSKTVKIKVTRRGNLNRISMISAKLDPKSKFEEKNRHVKFAKNAVVGYFILNVIDDDKYEKEEAIDCDLQSPVNAAVDPKGPSSAKLLVRDPEDMPTIGFEKTNYTVEEDIGTLKIKLVRTGDKSEISEVLCVTMPNAGNAIAHDFFTEQADYTPRDDDHMNKITFGVGESETICPIKINDNTNYESEVRDFFVKVQLLTTDSKDSISKTRNLAQVFIKPDLRDAPTVSFRNSHIRVTEDAMPIEVTLKRTGPDLKFQSNVVVSSKATSDTIRPTAHDGKDYNRVYQRVIFPKGNGSVSFFVTLIDDEDDVDGPIMEGEETFVLYFSGECVRCKFDNNDQMEIVITDLETDLPRVSFEQKVSRVNESAGGIDVKLIRSGDVTTITSVFCSGLLKSSKGSSSRKVNLPSIRIKFLEGERVKFCSATFKDDQIFSNNTEFVLRLSQPKNESPTKIIKPEINPLNSTRIIVIDDDKPRFQFEKTEYMFIEESINSNKEIKVFRYGDMSQKLSVRVVTENKGAKSGEDFYVMTEDLIFEPYVNNKSIMLMIYTDTEYETTESFILELDPYQEKGDKNMIVPYARVMVYIQDEKILDGAEGFPSEPVVVPLGGDPDPTKSGRQKKDRALAGYPLICITPCDPKYYNYKTVFKKQCDEMSIQNNRTRYKWVVRTPVEYPAHSSEEFVKDNGFLVNPPGNVLDSAFFFQSSTVQCIVTPVVRNGQAGANKKSIKITLPSNETACSSSSYGPTSYATFNYNNSLDSKNKFHLFVKTNHNAGTVVVVSMRTLDDQDIDDLLATSYLEGDEYLKATESQKDLQNKNIFNARCSNLAFYWKESNSFPDDEGFIHPQGKNLHQNRNHQHDATVRGSSVVTYYSNLDMNNCEWKFNGYFSLAQLTQRCSSIQEILPTADSSRVSLIKLKVPLRLYIVKRMAQFNRNWKISQVIKLDQQMTFAYGTDADIMLQGQSSTRAINEGKIYPSSMKIDSNLNLKIGFESVSEYDGNYLMNSSYATTEMKGISLNLKSIGKPTRKSQNWELYVSVPHHDYSGKYTVNLHTCLYGLDPNPNECTRSSNSRITNFDLEVNIQAVTGGLSSKVSQDVELRFQFGNNPKGFYKNERVSVKMISPNREKAKLLTILICQGDKLYIPHYAPLIGHRGCLVNNQYILTWLKLAQLDTDTIPVDASYQQSAFNVRMTEDGFSFDALPLFTADSSGNPWFLQVRYQLPSSPFDVNYVPDPSLDRDITMLGQDGYGTNLLQLPLVYGPDPSDPSEIEGPNFNTVTSGLPVLQVVFVMALIAVIIIIIVLVVYARRKRRPHTKSPLINGNFTPISDRPYNYPPPALKTTSDQSGSLGRTKGPVMFSPQVTTFSSGAPPGKYSPSENIGFYETSA